jgi:hypothetical protein
MIKVHYPSDIKKLKEEYLKIFNITAMESQWALEEQRTGFKLKDILIGDFEYLVDVFLWYKGQTVTEKQKLIYKSIFDYEDKQSNIAKFFMDNNNGFDLSTCHYCNMAYINNYSKSLSYTDKLDFINKASIPEWREFFNSKMLSDEKLIDVMNGRPYKSLDDFNRNRFLHKNIESYQNFSLNRSYNHFDLDHLLPKSVCPIIGLSLFNFVPSCQVCNEKLKKAKELAITKDDWLKISPTYIGSRFDDDVTIRLMPLDKCSTFFELKQNKDNYKLVFDTKGDWNYDAYVSMFKLNDRYNFHKNIALHILDLKERYPEEKRKEISRLLSASENEHNQHKYSEKQIEADILQEELYKDRCFSKLRQDMINKN